MAVLDQKLLSHNLDVVIGDRFFDLEFEYEEKGVDENGQEVVFNLRDNGDHGNEDMDYDIDLEDNGKDREFKRAKHGDGTLKENLDSLLKEGGGTNHDLGRDNGKMDAKIWSMAEQILNGACDKLIQECRERVMVEDEVAPIDGVLEDVTSEEEGDAFSLRSKLVWGKHVAKKQKELLQKKIEERSCSPQQAEGLAASSGGRFGGVTQAIGQQRPRMCHDLPRGLVEEQLVQAAAHVLEHAKLGEVVAQSVTGNAMV